VTFEYDDSTHSDGVLEPLKRKITESTVLY